MSLAGAAGPGDGEGEGGGERGGGSPEGGRREGGLPSAREALPPARPPEVATPHPGPGALPGMEEREFQDPQGVHWTVNVIGRAVSGTPPDRGAPLLLVRYQRMEVPEGEGGTPSPLEGLVVAGELATLSEEALHGLLARARPAPTPG